MGVSSASPSALIVHRLDQPQRRVAVSLRRVRHRRPVDSPAPPGCRRRRRQESLRDLRHAPAPAAHPRLMRSVFLAGAARKNLGRAQPPEGPLPRYRSPQKRAARVDGYRHLPPSTSSAVAAGTSLEPGCRGAWMAPRPRSIWPEPGAVVALRRASRSSIGGVYSGTVRSQAPAVMPSFAGQPRRTWSTRDLPGGYHR